MKVDADKPEVPSTAWQRWQARTAQRKRWGHVLYGVALLAVLLITLFPVHRPRKPQAAATPVQHAASLPPSEASGR
ncbi:hypothetical protein [Leeia aquatica]|uniref:Uncharacterized protein n=1 Tax=Leeia aquatica TaxID=2725557 RepID=A0A847S8M9_9NEIS|nr:hypothetical protein [Leeia aquatica]NLR73966.1 hypothetical protein [Leeia aquatica]